MSTHTIERYTAFAKRGHRRSSIVLVVASVCLAACGAEEPNRNAAPNSRAPTAVRLEPVVPIGSPFHGVHGLRFDDDDRLYAASVIGQSLFTVDVASAEVTTWIGPPQGMADDIAIAADGTFVWTAIEDGILYARSPEGEIRRVLEGYKGVNAVSFALDGRRLYLTLVFYGDALYEVDIYGDTPPRLIAENIGGLNAFQVGRDGMIYGPLVFGGRVVRIDPATGAVTTVSDKFASPGALKIEANGTTALVLDDGAEIKRVDLATGDTSLFASLPSGGDNLAIDSRGRVFVSLSETNAIYEIDSATGASRYAIEPAPLNSPAGFAVDASGTDTLYVGDLFGGIKTIDASSGRIDHAAVELFQPTHIAIDGGTLLAVSQVFGTIQRFDRATFDVLETWEGFDSPGDVVPTDRGIVVAETGSGRVLLVTGDTIAARTVLAEGLDGPVGLARAGDDAVFVSAARGGRVRRLRLDASSATTIAEGLEQPEGLAIDADGSLVVVEVGAKALRRITLRDGSSETIAQDLPIGLANGPSLYRDVEAGIGGLYLTSDVDNTIYRLAVR